MNVRPKKHLGQHFLKDDEVCEKIANAIQPNGAYQHVLEIGPGTGALTKHLLTRTDFETSVIEIDQESVTYLRMHYPQLDKHIYSQDFLSADITSLMGTKPFAVVGNFPYNISTQIVFKVLENKSQIPELVGMFQKEVAERLVKGPGTKDYGIVSVFVQAFYSTEYLFTVSEDKFIPPPKVKSGVIRLRRNSVEKLNCNEELFKKVVKMAFNQRRKTLRNSLKSFEQGFKPLFEAHPDFFSRRPETLSVDEFVWLTQQFQV
ncbi:MAG: 16S rRNA (adenine(1518)-N(6)/adenine(1519)-N(6))-dimethyltransferase RsmA [Crocinitomicaceae bacterium]|nr:16S rRNA (adenine(1518)-N(6)/adenine(1519)-N(6))-dimethyltransferase RsmA [Crocinitomicaceae bacterium]